MYKYTKSICLRKLIHTIAQRSSSQFTRENLMRRHQAERSVLIKYHGPPSTGVHRRIVDKCEQHGRVMKLFSWEAPSPADSRSILVEFEQKASIDHIHKSAAFFPDHTGFEVPTKQLYYKTYGDFPDQPSSVETITEDPPSLDTIEQRLIEARSLSHQMEELQHLDQLTDLGVRLRYFICSDLELALRRMLSTCYIIPFGSTMNGFGRSTGDLDMVLLHLQSQRKPRKIGQLYYLSKRSYADERHQSQMTLALISSIIQNVLPSYAQVSNILRARVPIVKFMYQPTHIECDLSVENMDCLPMTELLYNLTQMEPRLTQLLFVLRRWAYTHHVMTKAGTNNLSTFMLIMLSVHFLQIQQILPPLKQLVSTTTLSRHVKAVVHSVEFKTQNNQQAGQLLTDFFQYYADFNFNVNGVDVLEGCVMSKPVIEQHRAMYVKNPVVPEHNICQNVSEMGLLEFQSACLDAHISLEVGNTVSRTDKWGLLRILDLWAETRPHNMDTGRDDTETVPYGEDVEDVTDTVKLT